MTSECVCLMRIKQITLTAGKDIYTARAYRRTLYRAELAAQNPKCIDHHYNIIIYCVLCGYILLLLLLLLLYTIVLLCIVTCCRYILRDCSLRGANTSDTHTRTSIGIMYTTVW